MSGVFSPTRAKIDKRTLRTDKWWLEPLLTFSVLISFVIYATFRAFENDNYFVKDSHLISPFYSPCLSEACEPGATILGFTPVSAQIFNFALSPALIILIFPLGFRMTCYYYRKAYYRSFWLSPPACGVAEPHEKYTGETRFPLTIGGRLKHFSKHPVRYKLWSKVSVLNAKHQQFAWYSLAAVAFADIYVRQVATGAWTNFYFF